MNKSLIVVSGPMVREVFMNEDFNAFDSIDELTDMRAFFRSMTKSNHDLDNRTIHELIRDNITPNLPRYTTRIVLQLERNLDKEMAKYSANKREDGKILVEKPLSILQEMVANASMSCPLLHLCSVPLTRYKQRNHGVPNNLCLFTLFLN
jgi:hypothetical protein